MSGAADGAATGVDRRQLLVGGAFAALTAASWALRPRRTFPPLAPGALERLIPQTIGAYRANTGQGLIVPPADELTKSIYDQVLMRIYQAPDHPPVGMLVAYGSSQDTQLTLHRPEACYPGQGFAISDKHAVALTVAGRQVAANALTATRYDRREQLLYWTRIAGAFPLSERDQHRFVARENLAGRLPDGALVRFSAYDVDQPAAIAGLTSFANALAGSAPAEGRRILLG